MSEQTDLSLPASLPYPIKPTEILVSSGQSINRGTPLFHYSFKHKSKDQPEVEIRYGTWESPVEGTVNLWNIEVGDEVSRNYGPILVVTEPCKHGLQIAGMCANCGKDMTEIDYLTTNVASERAKIKMDYMADGPLLSAEEAARIERENTAHLVQKRKLSLIVDLDQTILHATLDPTVGEWIKEMRSSEPSSTTPPLENPNWPALADVVQFQLGDDHHGADSKPDPNSPWFYIKPRPGLNRFMDNLTRLYEMHVYTMGTRSYANAVCAAIDPTGNWFGSRILTRSESGSDRYKSLKRLFPSDQSMVAIIDDRADVWGFSPNLVKVVPFEFFVGTGDINSSFLPKVKPTELPEMPVVVPPEKDGEGSATDSKSEEEVEPKDIEARQEEQVSVVAKQQLEERPLAKAQESLEAPNQQAPAEVEHSDAKLDTRSNGTKKAVLKNDDRELDRVEVVLVEVHRSYYEMHDARRKSRTSPVPDLAHIIPAKRKRTFEGIHMVFSAVIPLGTRPDHSDIWTTALAFGAICHNDVNPKVTHLIAAKPGTVKADKAFELGTISVVNLQWFYDSIGKWERQPVEPYLYTKRSRRPELNTSAPTASKAPSDRNHGRSQANANDPNKDEGPSGGKVSRVEAVIENGTDKVASAPEPIERTTLADTSETEDASEETAPVDLQIDWEAVDREVDDALASDDEEGTIESDGTFEESRDMEQVIPTTRGIKRPRSDGSAPTTPSKLRFSTTNQFEDHDSPRSGKRQRIDQNTASGTSTGSPKVETPDSDKTQSGVTAEDDEDDDFLAREMAGGGETDDSSESEEE